MATHFGIDVGASAIKIAKVAISPSGSELTDYAVMPLDGREFGPEESPRLAAFLASRRMGKVSRAAVAISGRDLVLDVTSMPAAPAERLPRMIALYVAQFGERHDEPLSHDWGLLPIPGAKPDELTALVAMAKEPYLAKLRVGLERAGIGVDSFTPAPVALYNAYVKVVGPADGTTYLVDIGEKSIALALVKNGALLFARNIQGGLDLFVEPLMGAIEVKRARAMRFLVEEGKVGSTEDQETVGFKAGRALQGAAGQLVQMMASSVKFCQVKAKIARLEPDRYILSGGGGRMRGLAEYVAQATGKPAQLVDLAALGCARLGEAARLDHADGLASVVAVGAAQTAGGAAALPIQIRSSEMVSTAAFYSQTLVMAISLAATVVLLGLAGWAATSRRDAEIARDAQIGALFEEYKARHAEKDALEAARAALERQLVLVHARVEPGSRYFQALALVHGVLPDPMWLRKVALETEKTVAGETTTERVVLVIDGVVEESDMTVTTVEKLFETALATSPLVDKAGFTKRTDNTAAGHTEFTMKVYFREGGR